MPAGHASAERAVDFHDGGAVEAQCIGDRQLPGLLPTASVPLTMVLPTVPDPPRVPPESTVVSVLVEMLPFTTSLPSLTVVAPV